MNSLTLLLRPDLGKRAYRLRCRFTVNAFPDTAMLERAKVQAAEMFVRDMAKQGWEYLDKHGFKMTGPFIPMKIVALPKRHQQARWHTSSHELLAQARAGFRSPALSEPNYVTAVPALSETESWDFELAGVFVHKTILTESPDPHEEKEVLKQR